MAVDYTAYADQCEYFDEPSEETKVAARRVIASFANDAQDALDLFEMLGVHPRQLAEERWLKAEEAWKQSKRQEKRAFQSQSGAWLKQSS